MREIKLSLPWRRNSASRTTAAQTVAGSRKPVTVFYGFHLSSAEYILILDADFAPRPDLLNELLPYMERDRRIGIVQSPQFFRVLDQQNWIERGAGAVQELFYRAIQVSRQRRDGAICVGTCAVYRRAALEENGGPTLIEHSEDVHTGFDLRRLGWDLCYVPIALATGLCPDTADAFQVQQYRWCSGSLSLLSSKKFWRARLRVRTRMCYLSGFFYYIHTALFTFVGPLIPITLLLAIALDSAHGEHEAHRSERDLHGADLSDVASVPIQARGVGYSHDV